MELRLQRQRFYEDRTIGALYIGDHYFCDTLEPPYKYVAEAGYRGKGCIPTGEYPVTLTHSPRFDRRLPLVNGVAGFEGIRIHVGNYPRDTAGCILVGTLNEATRNLVDSRVTLDFLMAKINRALQSPDRVTLTIQ